MLALINAGHYPQATARLQALSASGALDAHTREGLVLSLQGRDCASVLQVVPPDAAAPLTTAAQQLAAGYCSGVDAALAERHFAAARKLAGDAQPAIAAQALTGQAQAMDVQGNQAGALAALAEAVRIAPGDPQVHASYGYQLKAAGQPGPAAAQFETALQLDARRSELMPELAALRHQLGQSEDSARWGRLAVDRQADIAQRLDLNDDEAQRRLFGWRRDVQSEEDRLGWYFNSNVRLDHGPRGSEAVSPVDYAQYGGAVNTGASYRFTPLGAQLPTWAFARASQGLDDRSLSLTPDSQLVGTGVRQRLSQDYLVVGSAEYLWRKSAPYPDDFMLRLSGSNTWGSDWNPVDASWTYANLYGDLAWLVRQRSYFLTLNAEWGRVSKLPTATTNLGVMPYLVGGYSANNDGLGRVDVTRLDVGLGIALLGWHREDTHRAPAINQRLSLEVRHAIGGNAGDRQTVQLKWIIQH